MKPTFQDVFLDLTELKIIQDELERDCFDSQQELLDEIWDRVLKKQIAKAKGLYQFLLKTKKELEEILESPLMKEATALFGKYVRDRWEGQYCVIIELLGTTNEIKSGETGTA
jgi:hypothetical protein